MSLDKWLEKWKVDVTDENFIELEKEKEWCNANNINFTPEILINGRAFPKEYDRTDLQYFIDDIIEEELQKKETLVPEMAI